MEQSERDRLCKEAEQYQAVCKKYTKCVDKIAKLQDDQRQLIRERTDLGVEKQRLITVRKRIVDTALVSPREEQITEQLNELVMLLNEYALAPLGVRKRKAAEIKEIEEQASELNRERDELQWLKLLPDSGLQRDEAQRIEDSDSEVSEDGSSGVLATAE